MNNYIREIKIYYRQLDTVEYRSTAFIGLTILVGIPIIGILAVTNLLLN